MSSGPIGAESGGASGRQPAFEPAGTWDLPSGSMLRVMGHDVSPLGLAHVDLMDLHVVREDGVPMTRDVLPSAVIDDRYSKAAGSGASWNRWSFYWDMIERRPNELTWEPVDAIVARDRESGLQTLAILQGVPSFRAGDVSGRLLRGTASSLPGGASGRYGGGAAVPSAAPPPRELAAPIFLDAAGAGTDDPGKAVRVNPDNAWAAFVDAAVERYRPDGELARLEGWATDEGVSVWEIGNEPNLPHFWGGTVVQFARYFEVAYLVIERRDPDATVIHGGVADHPSARPWFVSFLDALNDLADASPLPARHGMYLDASVWHWYTFADRLRTGPAEVRNILADRGFSDIPIWVTEMGVPIWSEHPGPCWDPTSPWRATTDEQAAYVIQSVAEGLAADVKTMIHFQAFDDCGNGPSSYDAFGLLRNHRENQCWESPGQACWRVDDDAHGTPRPAYHAFLAAADALSRAERLWRPAEDPSGWQRILFYRPPNERVSVVWSLRREPSVAEFFGTGPEARVFSPSEDGRIVEMSMAPVAGRLRIELPPMTNLNDPGTGGAVMAGHPIIVIEADTSPPFRAELSALPERSAARVSLTARVADGGTGVSSVRLLVANAPPESAEEWTEAGDPIPWPVDPLSGEIMLVYDAAPGDRVFFAIIASDRAGNWTSRPSEAQAWTQIEGAAPTPSPSPTLVATPAESPTPLETPPATPDDRPTPSPTPRRSDLFEIIFLPFTRSD